MKTSLKTLTAASFLCGTLLTTSLQADVGTAWTYQGELTKSGVLYAGSADLQFSLWTGETTGSQSGHTLTVTNLSVAAGRFTSRLDFGYDPFGAGQNLWLQIAVRTPAGSGAYSLLGNRQAVTPAPYAIRTRGMFVDDTGNVGIGTSDPSLDLQVSRTRNLTLLNGPLSSAMGVRYDTVRTMPSVSRTTNWLYLRASSSGADIARNDGSDLHFLREPSIADPNPLAQMTLTDTGKLLLGTETEQAGLTLQVGSLFGISYTGRLGFENTSPQAKIHFSNTSSTDCIRFPNGTVQNTAPFTDAAHVSGPGGVPAVSSTAFMTPVQVLHVTHKSQKVFVTASLSLTYYRESKGLFVYIGYRPLNSPSSPPVLIGQGLHCWSAHANNEVLAISVPISVSAIIENLDPGNYVFGMAGNQSADAGFSWGAQNGCVSAFVF